MRSATNEEEVKRRPTPIVSMVLADGKLIETIYQADRGRTTFIVGQGETWTYEKEIVLPSGETLVPISPSNSLLRHEVVLLPDHAQEYGEENELVSAVAAYIHRYVDLSPTFERLAAHYVLFSWVYDAFKELPYIRFRGDYGTGKTRALLTVGSVCYKAFFASGASTVSPIFHILDDFRGTLILDEADFRFSDEKAQLTKILNNGNVKGLPVLRSMPTANGKEFNPRAFNVFSPKILASRGSFDDRALESRFLTEEMGRQSVRDDISINLPDEQKVEAQALRNKLLVYRLRNRHLMMVDDALIDLSLEPRFNQILVPLLTVIEDGNERRNIQRHVRLTQNDLIADRGESIEGQIVTLLAEMMATASEKNIAVAMLVAAFTEKYGTERKRPMSGRWMGSILRQRLHLGTFRCGGAYFVSLGDTNQMQCLFRRFGLTEDAAVAPGR